MGSNCKAATQQTTTRSSQVADVRDRECDLLHRQERLFVADAAKQLSAVEDRVWLFLAMDTRWRMEADQCGFGAPSAPSAQTTGSS